MGWQVNGIGSRLCPVTTVVINGFYCDRIGSIAVSGVHTPCRELYTVDCGVRTKCLVIVSESHDARE